jgi:hypothetical protein
MAKQAYEFTLILSGVAELTPEVLDAFFEAGCDDALIGMRDGVAYADFCREGDSFQQAVLSAIRDVESVAVGAQAEHVEPDELVTMSEIARRLHLTREAIRKRVSGLRGPGNFPPPAGSLTQRSPVWHWTDVLRWHQSYQQGETGAPPASGRVTVDTNPLLNLGTEVAALNAALDLRRRVPLEKAVDLRLRIGASDEAARARTRKPRRAVVKVAGSPRTEKRE